MFLWESRCDIRYQIPMDFCLGLWEGIGFKIWWSGSVSLRRAVSVGAACVLTCGGQAFAHKDKLP